MLLSFLGTFLSMMVKSPWVLAIILWILGTGPSAAQSLSTPAAGEILRLDLPSFLARVEEANPDIQLAAKGYALALTLKREAASALLPKVYAQGELYRNLNDSYLYINFPDLITGETTLQKFKSSFKHDFSLDLLMEQVLVDLKSLVALKAARQYGRLSRLSYGAQKEETLTLAKKAYYQSLFLRQVWEINRSRQQSALEIYESVQIKEANGLASKFDLLQAEIRWRNSIPESQKAGADYGSSLRLLKNLAGISQETPLEPDQDLESLPQIPPEVAQEAAPGLVLENLLGRRQDYQMLLWDHRLKETALQERYASYLPVLKASLSYSYQANSDRWNLGDNSNKLWRLGLQLSAPLFTGCYRQAQVEKARIQYEQSEIRVRQVRNEIYHQVTDLRERWQELIRRIESARKSLETAEQAFGLAQDNAESGLIAQFQLNEARDTLDQARLNYFFTLFSLHQLNFDWQQATGLGGKIK